MQIRYAYIPQSNAEGSSIMEKSHISMHISMLTDAYKNPIGRVIVLHQITQHKRDQTELKRARDQLEMTVSERTLTRRAGLVALTPL